MSWFRPGRMERLLAASRLQEALVRAEDASGATAPPPPAVAWLEVGTRIAAVTEGGTHVEGVVTRIYQAHRDVAADVFRFACEPAEDGSSEEGEAS